MTRYVAFLHNVNSGSTNTLKMEILNECFASMGFSNISTYAQNGNVLFETEDTEEKILRKHIETNLEKAIGLKITVIIRPFDYLKTVIDNNPFDNIKTIEESKWYITFLSAHPANDAKGSLGVYSNDAEYARIVMREVYIYAKSYNTQTHFSNAFIERKLGLSATTRNWATVKKMSEL